MSNGLNALETLTDTTIDSVLGYEKAAETATNAQLAQTLRESAQERRQLVGQMNAQIVQMGGTAREDGSFSGGAHRVWTDITTAFGDKNEGAVERVEEGEDYLKKKFEAALKDDSLPAPARQIVQQGYTQVCEGERMADRLTSQFD
ncbi:MAG: PA2169 family four-helix-bundle protein [Parerythrobacter sp.]